MLDFFSVTIFTYNAYITPLIMKFSYLNRNKENLKERIFIVILVILILCMCGVGLYSTILDLYNEN